MKINRLITRMFGHVASSAAVSILCISLTSSLSGCGMGGGDVEKGPWVTATGKVEFDGKPVPAGTVSFLNHKTGKIATCPIYDGVYENPSDDGPNPGANVVSITAMEEEEGNPMWAQPWTKQVNVGETDFTEDFAIASSEVKPFDPSSRPIDVD